MKTILITGAGRGIGLEITKQHLERGDTVIAAYRSKSSGLDELKKAFAKELITVQMDVACADSVKKAAEFILQHTNHLDILYNNAGVYRFEDEVPFEETDLEAALDVLNINSVGFLRVTQALLPIIGQGTMVCCTSSEAGSIQKMSQYKYGKGVRYANYAYCMSKAAMNMAGGILRDQITKKGAALLLIHPGWVQTEMGGPNAVVPTIESASGLVAIACGEKPINSGFVDYTGATMPL